MSNRILLSPEHCLTGIGRTGATGYVGGEALHSLYNATTIRPQITALVRNAQKGAEVAKQYPEVKVVHGDLDALDLIREESRKADAVFRRQKRALSDCCHTDLIVPRSGQYETRAKFASHRQWTWRRGSGEARQVPLNVRKARTDRW